MENDINKNIDRYDIAISISCGVLTATMDALLVSDISIVNAHDLGRAKVDDFVIKVAQSGGYKGNDRYFSGF